MKPLRLLASSLYSATTSPLIYITRKTIFGAFVQRIGCCPSIGFKSAEVGRIEAFSENPEAG